MLEEARQVDPDLHAVIRNADFARTVAGEAFDRKGEKGKQVALLPWRPCLAKTWTHHIQRDSVDRAFEIFEVRSLMAGKVESGS